MNIVRLLLPVGLWANSLMITCVVVQSRWNCYTGQHHNDPTPISSGCSNGNSVVSGVAAEEGTTRRKATADSPPPLSKL